MPKIRKEQIAGALTSKIITATRDASSASGDVAYTGVGFTPSSIHLLLVMSGTVYGSNGVSDSNKTQQDVYSSAAGVLNISSGNIGTYSNQSAWAQNALVKSYDADGFTLTWSKVGTPTAGVMNLVFLCIK